MQQVNYVPRSRVLYWINHQAKFTQIPYRLEWGIVNDIKQLTDAINALKRTEDDMIDLSRLAQCLQSFHTSKMPAGANRMLFRIMALVKSDIVKK